MNDKHSTVKKPTLNKIQNMHKIKTKTLLFLSFFSLSTIYYYAYATMVEAVALSYFQLAGNFLVVL